MHRSLLLFFSFLIFSFSAAGQVVEEQPLKSAIKDVRVYLNRAAVTEEAAIMLQPGDHMLVFTGLSRTIQPQSIQMRGTGAGIIQSVTYRTSYLSRTPKTPRMLQLEDSLTNIGGQLEELANQEFVLKKEEELILKNNELGKDGGLTAEELTRLSAFYARRLGEIKSAQLKTARLKKDLELRRADYTRELGEINQNRNQPTQEVVVAYKAERAGKVVLKLDYLVGGAGWAPLYDLRAKSDPTAPIALSLKANVVNNTGIDWKGVKLTLSTANPAVGGTPPSISTLYVDRYQPQAYGASRTAPSADEEFADYGDDYGSGEEASYDKAEESPAPQATTAASYTEVQESALAIEYQIAIPYDIATDGKPRLVDIQDYQLSSSYAYYAAPRYDSDAFLQAGIGGWEQYNLLAGKANVYFDGAFLTETYLDPSSTQDTLRVGLGRDPQIIIKREQVKDYTSKKTIGNNIRETRGYTIEVRNTKKQPVTLVIEDQFPVSRNKDIEVLLAEGHGAEVTLSNGRLRWTLTLNPSETKKLQFQFEVKYPKDWVLTGF